MRRFLTRRSVSLEINGRLEILSVVGEIFLVDVWLFNFWMDN